MKLIWKSANDIADIQQWIKFLFSSPQVVHKNSSLEWTILKETEREKKYRSLRFAMLYLNSDACIANQSFLFCIMFCSFEERFKDLNLSVAWCTCSLDFSCKTFQFHSQTAWIEKNSKNFLKCKIFIRHPKSCTKLHSTRSYHYGMIFPRLVYQVCVPYENKFFGRRTPTSWEQFPFLRSVIEVYGKVNAISFIQTRDWQGSLVNEFDSFCRLLKKIIFGGPAPSLLYSNRPWKANRKSQMKFSWADADARWNETSLRLNVHMVPLGSPRDTSISLHCNYVWWQNYDSRMAGWPEVKCLVRRYFIAHLTNTASWTNTQERERKDMQKGSRRTPFGQNTWEISRRDLFSLLQQILIASGSSDGRNFNGGSLRVKVFQGTCCFHSF